MLPTTVILDKQRGNQYNCMSENASKSENLTLVFRYIGLLISEKTR